MGGADEETRETQSADAPSSSPSSSPPPGADPPAPASPITDSPWFWVYLFACAGLILLVVAQPRFTARQNQIERKAQGRIRGAQNLSGQEPNTPMSEEGQTQIQLWPLYLTLTAVFLLAWCKLWSQRFRHRAPARRGAAAAAESTSNSSSAKEPAG